MTQRSRRRALPSAWPIAGGRITVALVIGRLTEGATQRQLVALARGLDRRRHAVVVYCLSALTHPYGPQLEAEGHPVRTISAARWDTRRLVALARALRRDGVDVVHAFGWSGGAHASLAARLARIATVVVSVPRAADGRGRTTRYLRRDALRRATVVLAESHSEASRLYQSFGVPVERLRIVYDGVAVSRFPAPGRLEALRDLVRAGPPVVAVSAPWTSAEARATVEQAAARVLEERPDTRFVCFAPREHASVADGWARDRALPATVVTSTEGRTYELGRGTVLWAVGADRPILTCMLEAMAAARPVIATRGADSERIIVDGATGILTGPDDPVALAAATLDLARNGARRRELGNAARGRAERTFSVAQLVADVAAVYQHALLGLIGADAGTAAAPDAALFASPSPLVRDR